MTGGVAAASRFCPVFWMPRARPAQLGPAYSATAVNASPLVLTASTAAASSAGTASDDVAAAAAARATRIAEMARAKARIGRIRLPARSDQYPAAGAGQWRAVTRKTRANVATVNCGT